MPSLGVRFGTPISVELCRDTHDANYSNVAWDSTAGSLTFNLSRPYIASLDDLLPLTYDARGLQS